MHTLRRVAPPIVAGVLIVLLWELAIALWDVDDFLLPRPSSILEALGDNWDVIELAARNTFWNAFRGLLLGSSLGFAVALITTRFRALERGLTPLAIIVAATPILVVAPIANIWFGLLNPFAKISVVAVVTFFPVYLHAARGLNSVAPTHLELMHSLGSSRLNTLLRLRIPASLPLLFVGLKIAASLSMITTIVAEYFGGSRRALGVYISQQASLVRFDAAWAGIVVACSLALLLYGAVLLFERLLAPWQPRSTQR